MANMTDYGLALNSMMELAAHHRDVELVSEILGKLQNSSLTEAAEDRIAIYHASVMVTSLSYPLEDKKILDAFKDLEAVYKPKSADVISEELWVEIRRDLVLQLALSLLVDRLGMVVSSTPTQLRDIAVPNNFNYKLYVEDITQLFEELYEGDLEDQKTVDVRSFTIDLSTKVGRKTTLSDKKVHDLFTTHSLESTKMAVNAFLSRVEETVLGIPTLQVVTKKTQSAINDAVDALTGQDWSVTQAETEGPYAKGKKGKGNKASGAKASSSKAAVVASPVPEADLSFTSPPASGSQSRVQPDPPGRKHSTTADTTASKTQPQVKRAVRDFKSKYAAQDPLEDALQQQAPASPARVNNKRKAVISAPQASDGGKRRKKVVEEDADDEEDGDEEFTQPQRPASTSPQKKSKAGALTMQAKRQSGPHPRGTTIDGPEFDDTPQGSAVQLLRDSLAAIEGPKKIGMPSPRLVDQKSHNATSSANAGPTKLIVHANRVIRPEVFNRNPKMGVRHRLRWRAEEKKALLDGLAKYGMGQWAKIVKDSTFGGILANRTNVDLKDKYRTMAKNQELDADDVQSDYDENNASRLSNSAQKHQHQQSYDSDSGEEV